MKEKLCNLALVLALIVCLSAGIILLPSESLAKADVVYASYKYVMGDNDTKNDAKRICFIEAKRRCLEKAGTYIESQTEVQNYHLTKDEIKTYAAALVKVEVANEEIKYEGESIAIFMTVKAEVDTSYIDKQLSRIRADKSLKQKLEQQNVRLQELERKYVQLQKQLKSAEPSKALTLRKKRVTVFEEIDETEKRYAKILRSLAKRKSKSVNQAKRILQFVDMGMTLDEVEYIMGRPDRRKTYNLPLQPNITFIFYGRISIHAPDGKFVKSIFYNGISCELAITIKNWEYNALEDGIRRTRSFNQNIPNECLTEVKQYVLGE